MTQTAEPQHADFQPAHTALYNALGVAPPDPAAPPPSWTDALDSALQAIEQRKSELAADASLDGGYRSRQIEALNATRHDVLNSAAELVSQGRARLGTLVAQGGEADDSTAADTPWKPLLESSLRIERALMRQNAEAEVAAQLESMDAAGLIAAYRRSAAEGADALREAFERRLAAHLRRHDPQWMPVFETARRQARPASSPQETYRKALIAFARSALGKASAVESRTAYARLHRHYRELVEG